MSISTVVLDLQTALADAKALQSPPAQGAPAIAAGVLASFPSPAASANGIIGGKHVACTFHPPSGRIYMNGGDFINPVNNDSYQQQTFSLDLAAFIAGGGGNAGWRLEYPYNGFGGTTVQPMHPDYTGFEWDASRGVFWMVPGLTVNPGIGVGYVSPPGANMVAREVMTFNPTAAPALRWQRTMVSIDVSTGEKNADDTNDCVYDPVKDVIVRPGRGRVGVCFDILDCKTLKWSTVNNPSQVQIQGEKIARDLVNRVCYQCNLEGHLMRWSLDTYALEDLGPLPGGVLTTMANYTTLVWDGVNRVLYYSRAQFSSGTPADGFVYVYHPTTKVWENVPEKTTDGSTFIHRMSCFHPTLNCTLFFGGILDYASLGKARLYLFRYK